MAVRTSRSALEFMRRNGLIETPRAPRPRLNFRDLIINTMGLKREQVDPDLMLDADGDPPPDRGVTDRWPPEFEVLP